jgi:excisionase family DNA binding protein
VRARRGGHRMKTKVPAQGARLVSVAAVAEQLGVSIRMVWTLIASGQIQVIRLGKRATRIEVTEIERFLAEAKDRSAR